MRAVIQRVEHASVAIQGDLCAKIDKGLLILLGVGHGDSVVQAEELWNKIRSLRVFKDKTGKTNLSLEQIHGEVLVVSQFTLYANCRKGRRPSFVEAEEPIHACELYNYFCALVEQDLGHVEHGKFGADMSVSLCNDGPFTLILDSQELESRRA